MDGSHFLGSISSQYFSDSTICELKNKYNACLIAGRSSRAFSGLYVALTDEGIELLAAIEGFRGAYAMYLGRSRVTELC